jgi:uncharacterized protein YlxW (UPF0749 family)
MAADPHPRTAPPPQEDAAGLPGDPASDLPEKVRMPLLDYITAHSLDEDYAHVAGREHFEEPDGSRLRPGLAGLVIMGLFGLLIVTAAVQTSRNAENAESGRDSLITQIKARTAQVQARRDRVTDLRAEVESLQSLFLDTSSKGRALSARLDRLGALAGSVPVTGPGVKVVVDDAEGAVSEKQRVLDEDLQKLVNALWASGAEAVSINGQRITNLSAIRVAGSAITVNYKSLDTPYTVLAIGNPDTMPAQFVDTEHGSDWLDLQAIYQLQFSMTSEESLRVPAANRLNLRHAAVGEMP